MPTQQQIRRVVMTSAVAAITATGAWYGAGLKTQQEYNQGRKIRVEASPIEKIAQLEQAKIMLVRKRNELQRKIKELDARSGKAPVTEAQSGEG